MPKPTPRIRKIRPGEEPELWQLFFHTIRNVNLRDYSEAQVRAWAPDDVDPEFWRQKIVDIDPFVCELEGRIAGYADLQGNGYIDHFFVHHEHQGQGVGKALLGHIEAEARRRAIPWLWAQVSITARPFFESRGFQVEQQQSLPMRDQVLTNFVMHKALEPAAEG